LKTFKVIFESTTIPSDGDFYQFRYLRGEQVYGASIPFQLKIPMSFATIEKDEFLIVETEENATDSMMAKVEMLTSQNLELQSQLFEATSIIANLKEKAQETSVIEPPENSEIPNEYEGKANPGDEQDIPCSTVEKSLSPASDFSFVQPHGVTLEVKDDTRLEVEPSSLNANGTQNVKITLQLSSDVKEALLQTEEELRQMASQNREIVEQHKQFHNSLTLITQSTLQLCDKVQKIVAEKLIENPQAPKEASEKDEVRTEDSGKVERLNNALKEKEEEIMKWKTNCLFLKKLLELEKDVTELQVSETKYSSVVAELTSNELLALGDLMFSDASLNGAALHELNDKIAGLKREFLEVQERHDLEFAFIRDRLLSLKLNNYENLSTANNNLNQGQVSASTGAIPKATQYVPTSPRPDMQAVLCSKSPPPLPPRRGRDGSVTIEVEERHALEELQPLVSPTNIVGHQYLPGAYQDDIGAERTVVTTTTTTTTSSVLLTDFGTIEVVQPEPLLCPICQKDFEAGKLQDLETHVEAHLEPNCQCPVCGKIIVIDRVIENREEYEKHVLSHFSEENRPNPIHDWFMNFE